jgi:hypothetical protein
VPVIDRGKYQGQPEVSQTWRTLADGTQHRLASGVGPGYPSSGYSDLVTMAEDLFPGSTVRLEAFDGGRRLMFHQAIGEPVALANGDEIHPHLLWIASLDTTWASGCVGFAHRPACSNQIPYGQHLLKVKRTTNHDLMLFERGAVLAFAMEGFEAFADRAQRLSRIPMTTARFEVLLQRVVGRKPADNASGRLKASWERKVTGIRYFWGVEVDRVGPNAWAAYNAFQSYELHRGTKGNTDRQTELVAENAQAMTNQAAELLLAV